MIKNKFFGATCTSFLSSGMIADSYLDPFGDENFVIGENAAQYYLIAGEYPRNVLAYPMGDIGLSGIVLARNTKITIYSQNNFEGQILFEEIGPALVNFHKDYLPKNDWAPLYSASVRDLPQEDLLLWENGSTRVTCN